MKTKTPVMLVVALSGILALGCVVMAVAHAGIEIPVLSRFGPQGNAAVPPAVVVFSVGALIMAALVFGSLRRRAWAWAGGIAVHALVVFGALTPYRGVGSLVAVVLSGAAAAILLSRPGRSALLPAR